VKAILVGTQRVAQYKNISRIILGPRYRVAVAKPIQLFGVDGKNRKLTFHQAFHHRSRYLNRYGHCSRLSARKLLQSIQQLGYSGTAVFDYSLGNLFSACIQYAHIVLLSPTYSSPFHSPFRAASSPYTYTR
jgi:hypothetical protein